MNMKELPYDKADAYSIEAYAKKLLKKTLKEVLIDSEELSKIKKVKGSLGQLVEKYYFLYALNNISGPDFPEAGLELKTTPVVKDSKRSLKAKERLVFNIINFEEEYSKEFIESSFWKKNQLLLLMFYLHEKESIDIELVFEIIRLFRFPAIDLKIIKDDWETIREKIRDGLAHEISEGDTFYLGACTKGANNIPNRKQPFSNVLAKQRAYSLKPKYLNIIIAKTLAGDINLIDQTSDYQRVLGSFDVADPLVKYSIVEKDGQLSPIVKSLDEFEHGETIEQLVIRRFKPYYGLSEQQLFSKLALKTSKAKSRFYNISKAILNVQGKEIEEFEKADIKLKTVRFERNGKIKEHMSFPQIKFKDIIEEDWENSELYNMLSSKFFFVVFKKDTDGNLILEKVKFWNMPWKDIETMHLIWNDTKGKILSGNFKRFIKSSQSNVGHVRPKGKDSKDLMETHIGTFEKKKSFWLNNTYVKSIID